MNTTTNPIRVAITGAAGQIGYSLIFRVAAGEMFGPNQPIILHLIEIEPALKALEGVVMELEDCAFPLVHGVVPTASLEEGFNGVNWALLVGAIPRKAGMERKDLCRTGTCNPAICRLRHSGLGSRQSMQYELSDRHAECSRCTAGSMVRHDPPG